MVQLLSSIDPYLLPFSSLFPLTPRPIPPSEPHARLNAKLDSSIRTILQSKGIGDYYSDRVQILLSHMTFPKRYALPRTLLTFHRLGGVANEFHLLDLTSFNYTERRNLWSKWLRNAARHADDILSDRWWLTTHSFLDWVPLLQPHITPTPGGPFWSRVFFYLVNCNPDSIQFGQIAAYHYEHPEKVAVVANDVSDLLAMDALYGTLARNHVASYYPPVVFDLVEWKRWEKCAGKSWEKDYAGSIVVERGTREVKAHVTSDFGTMVWARDGYGRDSS
ncbi:hypothetical protein HK104_001300 [Borealophlyctis nickersoniae]|nr:hypothetical protein HK104_001300 [Borealophlyctis nickersoniae]